MSEKNGDIDRWERLKAMLIDRQLGEESIEQLRSEVINTIRFEREMMQQEVTNKDIKQEEQIKQLGHQLDDLSQRIKKIEDWKNLYRRQLDQLNELINKIDQLIDEFYRA